VVWRLLCWQRLPAFALPDGPSACVSRNRLMTAGPVLVTEELRRRFRAEEVVRGVSHDRRRRTMAILGPSGCSKTILLHMLRPRSTERRPGPPRHRRVDDRADPHEQGCGSSFGIRFPGGQSAQSLHSAGKRGASFVASRWLKRAAFERLRMARARGSARETCQALSSFWRRSSTRRDRPTDQSSCGASPMTDRQSRITAQLVVDALVSLCPNVPPSSS
jgi:hypothetical protein